MPLRTVTLDDMTFKSHSIINCYTPSPLLCMYNTNNSNLNDATKQGRNLQIAHFRDFLKERGEWSLMPMHAVATVECPWWIIIKKGFEAILMIVIKEQWWDVITMIIWYRKSGPNPMACSWKIQWISHIKVFWLPAKKVKGVVPTFTYPRMLLRLMTILGDIVNHHWWCHSILVRMGGVEMVRQS